MKCPKCQTSNPENKKFCRECGAKLLRVCPQCGAEILPTDRFCGDCGHNLTLPSEGPPKELSFDEKIAKIQRYLPKGVTEKILSQRDRIEGERKQVTVMFCDMEGFTTLSERIGPEEAYAVMDQVYEILIHKVHDYEGTVNEMTGDGIMALFGAPIALEDAPQRAIRSAYAIHREMTRFSDRIGREKGLHPVRMRIGIHTGPAVVGTLGNDLRVEFKAVGDTVNLASRVEGLAEPGTTYVTEETFKLTEGLFRFEDLGAREVKGKREPIRVYRVIALRSVRTRFDVSAERGLTPLVGREREIELLLDGFERVKSGRGQAFSIMGEAGMGKSRLLYEFRKAVANEDATFLEGNCLSYSRNLAYYPLIDVLKSYFNIYEGDRDLEIREKVTLGLSKVGVDGASTLPYILELLSVRDSGIDEISTSPQVRKSEILESMKRIVLKGAEIRPLIMAVENLHWIDRSSEDALKYMFDSISGAPVLMIFTYRPEYVLVWGGKSYHSQMGLHRLSNRETLLMVNSLLGAEDIHSDIEELVIEKTEGVPFFIEELVKSLQEFRIIEKDDAGFRMAKAIQSVTIPAQIQDVIMARLDALPEGARSLAQAGSVIGREFGYDLIKKVMRLPEQELLSRLSVLKDSELVYERGIYPEASYVFKHALVQDVAYHSLMTSARQRYHGQIADVLEQQFPKMGETQPELLGYHLMEGGSEDRAVGYWQKAGENAMKRSAHVEAVAHFTKGIELLKKLPQSPERAHRELSLRISMGPALLTTEGYAASGVGENYTVARELCQRLGDTQKLKLVLYGLRVFHLVRAEYQKSHDLAEELMNMARREQDEGLEVLAHRALGTTFFWLGIFDPARRHLGQAAALYDPQKHAHLTLIPGTHVKLHPLLYECLMLQFLGYPDQAIKLGREALVFAGQSPDPFSHAAAIFFNAWLHFTRRDIPASKEHAESAMKLSTEKGFPFWRTAGEMLLGWIEAMEGQATEGIAKIRHAYEAYRTTGGEQWRPVAHAILAEAYLKADRIEEGLRTVDEGFTLVEKTGERFWETELHRLKGELLLVQSVGNEAEAEGCYSQAIEIARKREMKSLELRAAMSLSRLWQSQGKRTEARELLAPVFSWFTEGFDTADLKEARALLEGL